jgi:hypothetical protein
MTFDPVTAANRILGLFNDETVQQILHERKMMYFNQWLDSKDPSERERIYAEARAFGALNIALQAVVDAGLQEQSQPLLERRSE